MTERRPLRRAIHAPDLLKRILEPLPDNWTDTHPVGGSGFLARPLPGCDIPVGSQAMIMGHEHEGAEAEKGHVLNTLFAIDGDWPLTVWEVFNVDSPRQGINGQALLSRVESACHPGDLLIVVRHDGSPIDQSMVGYHSLIKWYAWQTNQPYPRALADCLSRLHPDETTTIQDTIDRLARMNGDPSELLVMAADALAHVLTPSRKNDAIP